MSAPTSWQRASSLSLTEAAAVLGQGRSVTYGQAADGTLPTVQDHLGDHRVLPVVLEAILAARAATEQGDLFSGADL